MCRAVILFSPTVKESPPPTSMNFFFAVMADMFTGKYGIAICVSKTCFKLSRPRCLERKL